MSGADHLFSQLALREVTLRNRIVISPMQQYMAGPDGLPRNFHISSPVASSPKRLMRKPLRRLLAWVISDGLVDLARVIIIFELLIRHSRFCK